MTIQSWLEEFMPEKPTADMTRLEAIEHAVLKYSGTTKKNLDKHGLQSTNTNMIVDKKDKNSQFYFSSSNCSLCKLYDNETQCPKCPLQLVGHWCGSGSILKEVAWKTFYSTGNAASIRKALNAALELVKAGG